MNTTPELALALERHQRLAETLGIDHPDTRRAMLLVMELAPKELQDLLGDMARKMGLMPEACGYLEDGTPVYCLEDVAKRLGTSPAQAEAALQENHAERDALGLPNTGIVAEGALIHPKQ